MATQIQNATGGTVTLPAPLDNVAMAAGDSVIIEQPLSTVLSYFISKKLIGQLKFSEVDDGQPNSVGDIFIYVNAVTGNDGNSGKLPSQAVKTFDKAMSLIPAHWQKQCKVVFAPGDYYMPDSKIYSVGVPNGPYSTWCLLQSSYTNEVGTRSATFVGNVITAGGAVLPGPVDKWAFYYVSVIAHGPGVEGITQQRVIRANSGHSITTNEIIKPVVGATSYTCQVQRGAARIHYHDYNSFTVAGGGIGMLGLTFIADTTQGTQPYIEMYAGAVLGEGCTFIGGNNGENDFELHIGTWLPQNNSPWLVLPQAQRPFSTDLSWNFDDMDPNVPRSGQNLPACVVFINHFIYTDEGCAFEGWAAFDGTYMYCGMGCTVELAQGFLGRNSTIQMVESTNMRLPDYQFGFLTTTPGLWVGGYPQPGFEGIGMIDLSLGSTCNIDNIEIHSTSPDISPIVLADCGVINVGNLSGSSTVLSPFLVKGQSLLKIDVPSGGDGSPTLTTILGPGAEVIDFELQGVAALQTTYAAVRQNPTGDANGVRSVGGDIMYGNRATSLL